MATRVSSRFAPHDENAAVAAKSAQKSIQAPTTGLKPRQKLSNITNKIQQTPQTQRPVKPQPPLQTPQESKAEAASKSLHKTKPKQPAAATNKPKHQFSISEELQRKAEAWAKDGIERVHFSGDEMEALREKREHEEMSKRVKAVLSFRTEIFPTFSRPSLAVEKDPYDSEGNLKLDEYVPTYKVDADLFGVEDELDQLLLNECFVPSR